MENKSENQRQVDECYEGLSKEILWEMDKFKKIRKRESTPYKPYWNDRLSALWSEMRNKYQTARLQLKNVNKKKLRRLGSDNPLVAEYLHSQMAFDKELRNAKRRYSGLCVESIEKLAVTGNPRDFWNEVNKLGPRRKQTLVCEAFDEYGNVTREPNCVMDHWRQSFEFSP